MSNKVEFIENQKNNFYRDRYRITMKWLNLMVYVGVGLSLLLGYLSFRQPIPKFYATTTNGDVIRLYSLSEPVVTEKYLLQWASLRAREIYNLDFSQYQDELARIQPYFTSAGWEKLNSALKSSGFISQIVDQKLQSNAVVYKPPVVISRMIIFGRYTWRIQLPLLVTYTSANQQRKVKYLLTMDVQRVPVISAPKGIQIKSVYITNDQ